jgi:hypothetical protein
LSDEGSDEPAEGDAPLSDAFDGAPARLIVGKNHPFLSLFALN